MTWRYILVFSSIFSFILGSIEELENLIEYDKITCLEKLEQASDGELWDAFLEGQVDLFFPSESLWLAKNSWWSHAKKILEIGSGNGAFLNKLSIDFQGKSFQGFEILSEFVEKSNERYTTDSLTFKKGDANVYDESLKESADVVFFRATLQHLDHPRQALKNAAMYLKPNGYIVIFDSFDKAHKNSPSLLEIEKAIRLVSEEQKIRSKGNRKISFELLQEINSVTTELANLYELEFSSIDTDGNVIYDTIRFEGKTNRLRYFNHVLLILTLFQRTS